LAWRRGWLSNLHLGARDMHGRVIFRLDRADQEPVAVLVFGQGHAQKLLPFGSM